MRVDHIPMMQGLEARIRTIERAIAHALPGALDEDWLRDAGVADFPSAIAMGDIHAPGIDLIGRGGKRWRPLLTLLVGEAFGAAEAAAGLASVVEVAHTGSLIVDDIEDGSESRRGRPAAHLVYGTDVAINTGNLLYFLPTMFIERTCDDPGTRMLAFSLFHRAMRRLHYGQGLDILWHRDPDALPARDEYDYMCRCKSGSLAGLALALGAIAANCDETVARELYDIGEQFGVAFQIVDDALNLSAGNPGKDRGDDLIEGKKSLPIILHLSEHPGDGPILGDIARAARRREPVSPDRLTEIADRIVASGAVEEACSDARARYAATRDALLARLGGPSEPADLLLGLTDGLIASAPGSN